MLKLVWRGYFSCAEQVIKIITSTIKCYLIVIFSWKKFYPFVSILHTIDSCKIHSVTDLSQALNLPSKLIKNFIVSFVWCALDKKVLALLVKEYRKLTGHNLLYSTSNFALILHILFGPYITSSTYRDYKRRILKN